MNDGGSHEGEVASQRSRRYRIFLATFIVAAVAAGLFYLLGQMATARNAFARVNCQTNLKRLYPMIRQFVDDHDRLPLDDHGQLSLSQLVNAERANDFGDVGLHPCLGDNVSSCYLFATDVSPDDIGESRETIPKILLYDRPGNHIQVLANGLREKRNGIVQEEASLLLTDGHVVTWRGDSPDYAAWAQDYSQGADERYPPGIEELIRKRYESVGR